MVGRAELITPAIEQEIRKQILTFRTGDEQAKAQAVDGVRALRLGRFLNAAMTSITQGETDQQVLQAAWSLAHAASAEKVASAREAERSARN
jgi:hypothetical protein